VCGIEAPTTHVEFHQNIGMLVMRRHNYIKGNLCKSCIHKNFAKMTGTTLILGPWGTISLVLAPIFIINNLIRYLRVLGMPAVPPTARIPKLSQAEISRLQPLAAGIFERLNRKEPLVNIAGDISRKARVTPGQVVKYVVTLSKQGHVPSPATGAAAFRPATNNMPAPQEPIPMERDDEGPVAEQEET
jgi:hypothetical protein